MATRFLLGWALHRSNLLRRSVTAHRLLCGNSASVLPASPQGPSSCLPHPSACRPDTLASHRPPLRGLGGLPRLGSLSLPLSRVQTCRGLTMPSLSFRSGTDGAGCSPPNPLGLH